MVPVLVVVLVVVVVVSSAAKARVETIPSANGRRIFFIAKRHRGGGCKRLAERLRGCSDFAIRLADDGRSPLWHYLFAENIVRGATRKTSGGDDVGRDVNEK